MTLGANLEWDRLTQRARRVRAVIAALRRQTGWRRAAAYASDRHILRAIAEFEAELATIDARLSDLATGATPAQRRSDLPRDWTTT
ncbi:MAG: hypothetical protein ABSH51_30705 [Solirubrobacteraceae bacterium]|jgi:hypothetical protein